MMNYVHIRAIVCIMHAYECVGPSFRLPVDELEMILRLWNEMRGLWFLGTDSGRWVRVYFRYKTCAMDPR